ncbi:hypothetical protein C0992_004194 [Termitomyces sp. T32_za158]|nr:hypothetical protein C0992_004194 [Termitomyces sp. T32_za158]
MQFMQRLYHKWCKVNNFETKLPKDVEACKEAHEAAQREIQATLDPHLGEVESREKVIKYSDKLFCDVATE